MAGGEIRELVTSAFGESSCLYKDILQCPPSASKSELRKAYHKRALCFHPDKQSANKSVKQATLRFQAVSAAYQFLMDSNKRAMYDSTSSFGDGYFANPCMKTKKGDVKNKDWVGFFQSVFQELVNAGDFGREKYTGSRQERADVIKFYQLCKGDFSKIRSCIVSSEESDIIRWKKEIIKPAISNGEVQCFGMDDRVKLDNTTMKRTHKKKFKKLGKEKTRKIHSQVTTSSKARNKTGSLVDTDDEGEDTTARMPGYTIRKMTMSKRDKIEYRVAKKRKERHERDIEVSKLLQSKQWNINKGVNKKQQRFLSSLEKKFSR